METYKVTYNDDEETSLVYAISLVDDPANLSMFITMGKDRKELIKLSDGKEKRQVTGVVLIPNQLIYRYNEKLNKEFNLVFGEEEIRKLSIDFFKNGYQKNSNINHLKNETIKGLTFFESWIVTDPENDKAKALGFDVPAGTWMATAYVEDDKAWEMSKSGELKGFSIEAFLDFEKIEMNINKNNNLKNKKEKMSLLKQLISMFSSNEEIKMKSIESDLGPLTVDSLEEGAMVYQDVDGEMVPLTEKAFIFEGYMYLTDAEGKIVEISEVIEEIPVSDEEMEELLPAAEEEDKKEDEEEVMKSQKFEAVKTATGSDVWIDGEIAIDSYVYCKEPSIVLIDGVRSEMRYPIWESVVELEDGTILTLEYGKILKVEAKEAGAPSEPSEEEIVPSETEGLNDEKMSSETKKVIETITKNLESVIEENTRLKKEVENLGKQPAASKLGMSSTPNKKETYWETLARISKG